MKIIGIFNARRAYLQTRAFQAQRIALVAFIFFQEKSGIAGSAGGIQPFASLAGFIADLACKLFSHVIIRLLTHTFIIAQDLILVAFCAIITEFFTGFTLKKSINK